MKNLFARYGWWVYGHKGAQGQGEWLHAKSKGEAVRKYRKLHPGYRIDSAEKGVMNPQIPPIAKGLRQLGRKLKRTK